MSFFGERILIMGHRGASNTCPENTLKAFQKAMDLQADFIEFDVMQTKDGELVISHDEDVFRTTGVRGLISEMTLTELKQLDAGEGEKIPTLEELIELTSGKIGLNCEIKAKGIMKKAIEAFDKAGILNSVLISSFLHDELLKIKDINSSIRVASLEPIESRKENSKEVKEEMIQFVVDNNYYAINPLYSFVDEDFVRSAHSKNVRVFPWTVDSKIGLKKLVKYGVDGVITNDIPLAKDVLGKLQKK